MRVERARSSIRLEITQVLITSDQRACRESANLSCMSDLYLLEGWAGLGLVSPCIGVSSSGMSDRAGAHFLSCPSRINSWPRTEQIPATWYRT